MSDFIRVTCSVDGCNTVRVFSIGMSGPEVRRMAPRFLAAAGWLTVAQGHYCPRCAELLRERMFSLTIEEATRISFAVRQAISEAMRLRRIEVHG